MRKATTAIILFVVLAASACGGKSKSRDLVFVPDPAGSDPAVYLRVRSHEEGRLVLEVVGRSITALYGVAFRLRYDSLTLGLTTMTPGESWTANALSLATEPGGGLTVAAVTEKGQSDGFDASDTILAVLEFEVRSKIETPVEFVLESSAVVTADGTQLSPVNWSGGRLELQ